MVFTKLVVKHPLPQLTASDGAAFDTFGYSVAISGNNVVLGVPNDDIGSNSNQGSAYVFVWTTIVCCYL
jgi:FG-GAP repeat